MFKLLSESVNLDVAEALNTFKQYESVNQDDWQQLTEIVQCVVAQVAFAEMSLCQTDEASFYIVDVYSLAFHVFDSREMHEALCDSQTQLVKTYRCDNAGAAHEIICALMYNINVLNA